MNNDHTIRLHFKRGDIDCSPGEVQSLISDEKVRTELRNAVRKAREGLPVEVEDEAQSQRQAP